LGSNGAVVVKQVHITRKIWMWLPSKTFWDTKSANLLTFHTNIRNII
jgi:hypothetical protein